MLVKHKVIFVDYNKRCSQDGLLKKHTKQRLEKVQSLTSHEPL